LKHCKCGIALQSRTGCAATYGLPKAPPLQLNRHRQCLCSHPACLRACPPKPSTLYPLQQGRLLLTNGVPHLHTVSQGFHVPHASPRVSPVRPRPRRGCVRWCEVVCVLPQAARPQAAKFVGSRKGTASVAGSWAACSRVLAPKPPLQLLLAPVLPTSCSPARPPACLPACLTARRCRAAVPCKAGTYSTVTGSIMCTPW